MTEVISKGTAPVFMEQVLQDLDDRPPSRSSTASSNRLTREEVTLASGVDDLEDFCRQVFTLCDANGDGYITQDVRLYNYNKRISIINVGSGAAFFYK